MRKGGTVEHTRTLAWDVVAFFDTVPTDDDQTAFGGTWSNYPYFESGVIAVSSWNEGLFLLRKRQPVLVP